MIPPVESKKCRAVYLGHSFQAKKLVDLSIPHLEERDKVLAAPPTIHCAGRQRSFPADLADDRVHSAEAKNCLAAALEHRQMTHRAESRKILCQNRQTTDPIDRKAIVPDDEDDRSMIHLAASKKFLAVPPGNQQICPPKTSFQIDLAK
jgi:hypothetical protein